MTNKEPTKNVKVAVNLITVSVLDSLAADLVKLNLGDAAQKAVIELIEAKKEESVFDVPRRSKKSSTAKPIAKERQCFHEKDGKKCSAFITDKTSKLCWVHMSEKQKESYRKQKAAKK
jgi:hypothetical protein